jgi:hypothetical protein
VAYVNGGDGADVAWGTGGNRDDGDGWEYRGGMGTRWESVVMCL